MGDPHKATLELKWQAKAHWKEFAKLTVDSNLKIINN
jgi:GDP-D-mannose dehydratase